MGKWSTDIKSFNLKDDNISIEDCITVLYGIHYFDNLEKLNLDLNI